ncbi:MAG: alpha-glucan family phosphorylase [Mycobacteriales bacterium]
MRALRRFTVRAVLPEPLGALGELVMNLRWSWHPESMDLFAAVDPEVWEAVGHDPVRLLGAVSAQRMEALAADRRFLRRLAEAHEELGEYLSAPRWYQHSGGGPAAIAYFSPEFGITEVLPQYSGGLGILAGDHLKAASDLGVPVIGVGLLYRRGYFKQSLSADGWQLERYPPIDPQGLPLAILREPATSADVSARTATSADVPARTATSADVPARTATSPDVPARPLTGDGVRAGEAVKVAIALPGGGTLQAQVWVARVGRVPLLLLDSDVEENAPSERDVTDRLYGGGSEHRLRQELLLGVGGVRALRAYCRISGHAQPEVFHTNEGHAGFLGVERVRELMNDAGLRYEEALEAVRAGTVFTTHTPVPAGIDRFPLALIAETFSGQEPNSDGGSEPNSDGESETNSSVPVSAILALGREPAGGDPDVFNMAVMGLRLAQRANGVSRLHGAVSRDMFAGLWPGFDVDEVPISSVTNGVHAPTWVSREVFELAAREVGPELVEEAAGWDRVAKVSDEAIWATRRMLRARLVDEVRRRLHASWLARGAGEAELGWISGVFDPNVCTIGFARRVPSYKRVTLMLRDPDRLRSILLDEVRPVQIVIAGKAHPADDGGKALVQQIVRFCDEPAVRHRIAFLPDYDIGMARHLYGGCDVWLNNPLRPLEACGTSGMKSALNGGLNLSIRDGWWDEMFDGENGWAIPTAGVTDADRRDELEAAALYDLIENQVRRRFYDVDRDQLPRRWIEMVRHTLVSLGPQVLATRMVRDYVRQLYAPAAAASARLAGEGYAEARRLSAWKTRVRDLWPAVRVAHVETEGVSDAPEVGQKLTVRAMVALGELAPEDVEVQAVFGRVDERDELREPVAVALRVVGSEAGIRRYEGQVALEHKGPFGYTVRVLPANPLLVSSAEMGLVALPQQSAVYTDI